MKTGKSTRIITYLAFVVMNLLFVSCSKEELYNDLETLVGDGVIEINEKNVSGNIGKIFSKYSYVNTPNGGRIEIFGTSKVSDEQMLYAKDILKQYLTSEGTLYKKKHKKVIANSMANKKTALTFWDNEQQAESNIDKVVKLGYNIQDLYATESLNSGNRDASYEEILHMVHNYGIAPTLFKYQDRLQKANNNAIKKGIWKPRTGAEDLPKADFDDEYLAALMDCYLGLWEGQSNTMGGYEPTSKQEQKAKDPIGHQLILDLFGDINTVR
jgi:hypothetical protein